MAEQANVAATAADIMGQPLTTVVKQDHVAAAAYLMKPSSGVQARVSLRRPG